MIWVYLVLLLLMVALTVLSGYLRDKAVREMTVEKLIKRAAEYQAKGDMKGLSKFLSLHLGFIACHKSAIQERLLELSNSTVPADENLNKE